MNSPLAAAALPLALAVIMFGLGLSLTVEDFARVARAPRTVAIALACQLLVLPAIAFGLVLLFGLPPILAAGMMLLASAPGGMTASMFSHVFHGDVALNVSLTAVNSITAIVTMPLVTNFAISYFAPGGGVLGLQFSKTIQVFAIVLIPVVIGMAVRRRSAGFAGQMARPVSVGSALALVLVVAGTIIAEHANLITYLTDVGAITILFCLISLAVGFFIPRWLGVSNGQAIACAMEVGIHNSTIAITIAASVLGSTEMAIPAAVYGVLMFPLAGAAGWLITRLSPKPVPSALSGERPIQPARP